MSIFQHKQDNYKILTERITDVQQEVIILQQQLKSLMLENDDLRNKVLRKIQVRQDQVQDEVKRQLKAGQRMRG